MDKKVCSYCKKENKLTKEHLWPNSLHKRLYTVNQQNKSYFWLSKLDRVINGDPTIKDVCAKCNNETLSELDEYICKLFDIYFAQVLQYDEKISFEYNYHLLKRWLLKMCYNSARIHNSHDQKALEDLLPYILGKNNKLGRSTQLFVLLTYPEEVQKKVIDKTIDTNETIIIEPTIHRVGHMAFRAPEGQKVLRVVNLRSFTFIIAFWPITGGKVEQNYFESVIINKIKGIELIKASENKATLKCIGIGAWESLKDSRSKLEFSS